MKRIHYCDDFTMEFSRKDASGVELSLPEHDWRVIAHTASNYRYQRWEAGQKGGKLHGEVSIGTGGKSIVLSLNHHGLDAGRLMIEWQEDIPDEKFADGYRHIHRSYKTDIELVRGMGDEVTSADVAVVMPYIVAQMDGYAKKADVIVDGGLSVQSTKTAVVLELGLTDGAGESLSRSVTLPTATESGAGVVTAAQVELWNKGATDAEEVETKVDALRILPFDGFLETTEGASAASEEMVYFVKDEGRFMQQVDGAWTYKKLKSGYNMIVTAMPELGIAESVSANPWALFTWSGNLYRASGSELEPVAWSGDLADVEAGGVVRIEETTIDALLR